MAAARRAFQHGTFDRVSFDVEFWDDETDASETWTTKPKQGETWTTKAKQAEVWTPKVIVD